MKEFKNILQETIRQEINNRLDELQKDGYYISSVDSIGEIAQSVDATITNIDFTIKFGKIQQKAPKEILDKEEKEYLEHFLRPFRNRVEWIAKYESYSNNEYIAIKAKGEKYFELPDFRKNTMYKGMELDKEYTLEELGLFEGE